MSTTEARFERWLHDEITLTAAMGLQVVALTGQRAETRTPLADNHNIHGTGFAGSLYAQAMVTGWMLMVHHLELAGIEALLVQREGTIRYRAPVTQDARCRCEVGAAELAAFDARLNGDGRARITLEIEILGGAEPAATLSAEYSAHLKR